MNAPKPPLKSLRVTLSRSDHDSIMSLLKSGQYADESGVIREGLRLLRDRDTVIATWIQKEVVPNYGMLKADPTLGMSVDQLRIALAKKKGNPAP